MADTYCRGDFIFHLDSDTLLIKAPLQNRDLFLFGRPIATFDRYANVRAAGARLREAALDRWQGGTATALGLPSVEFEFSRSNDHLYPRGLYAATREHLEATHGVPLRTFLAGRLGRLTNANNAARTRDELPRLLSDFNTLGGYAYYRAPHLLAWQYVGADAAANASALPPHAQPYAYSVIRPQLTCQGNGRWFDELPKLAAEQLALMRKVATGAAPCAALDAWLAKHRPY
jgi:hypothetical protein